MEKEAREILKEFAEQQGWSLDHLSRLARNLWLREQTASIVRMTRESDRIVRGQPEESPKDSGEGTVTALSVEQRIGVMQLAVSVYCMPPLPGLPDPYRKPEDVPSPPTEDLIGKQVVTIYNRLHLAILYPEIIHFMTKEESEFFHGDLPEDGSEAACTMPAEDSTEGGS